MDAIRAQSLAGKRMIVTGGAQGLGREFSLHLAGLGACVLAADIEPEPLLETSRLAQERGTPILTSTTDVSNPSQTEALAGTARRAMGGLDALVNNAGVVAGLSRRPFEEIPEDEWDRVLAVNLKGSWLSAKAVVPLLRDAGRGAS